MVNYQHENYEHGTVTIKGNDFVYLSFFKGTYQTLAAEQLTSSYFILFVSFSFIIRKLGPERLLFDIDSRRLAPRIVILPLCRFGGAKLTRLFIRDSISRLSKLFSKTSTLILVLPYWKCINRRPE